MGAPTVRLHGSLASGSAAAVATPATLVVAATPANATPDDSSARRSNRPFPATCSICDGPLRRDLAMGPLPENRRYFTALLPSGQQRLPRGGLLGRARIPDDAATYHGHHRLDVLDLIGGGREVIAIEHQEIGVFAGRDRAEIVLLKHE